MRTGDGGGHPNRPTLTRRKLELLLARAYPPAAARLALVTEARVARDAALRRLLCRPWRALVPRLSGAGTYAARGSIGAALLGPAPRPVMKRPLP